MSSSYFMTPEERAKKKKRDKLVLNVSLIIVTALVTMAVTLALGKV